MASQRLARKNRKSCGTWACGVLVLLSANHAACTTYSGLSLGAASNADVSAAGEATLGTDPVVGNSNGGMGASDSGGSTATAGATPEAGGPKLDESGGAGASSVGGNAAGSNAAGGNSAGGNSAGGTSAGTAGASVLAGNGGGGTGGAASVQLATGKNAKASTQQTGYEAPKGNDLDLKTRWCASGKTLPQWWRVDLGGVHTLNDVTIRVELAKETYNYLIETSDDDAVYTLQKTVSGTGASQKSVMPANLKARYVRVTVTGVTNGNWASFFDLSVSGPN
jgi:F5/8 type C domain